MLLLKTFIDPKFSQPIPNIIINYIVNFVSSPSSSTITTLEDYKNKWKNLESLNFDIENFHD